METRQTTAGSLKSGSSVIFDGIACTVKDVQTGKTGKHGHAKSRIEAVGMIEGQKIIKVLPAHDKVDVPIVEKKTAQVLSVSGDTANVMDVESYETFDVKVPEDMKEQVIDGCQIVYWIIMDKKIVKQVK